MTGDNLVLKKRNNLVLKTVERSLGLHLLLSVPGQCLTARSWDELKVSVYSEGLLVLRFHGSTIPIISLVTPRDCSQPNSTAAATLSLAHLAVLTPLTRGLQ